MQKISSYLYPNRINVVADVTLFPVRWNIVYQNRVKIYQGIDNILTIDVKNSDQKRIDISEMDIEMTVTDVNNKEVGIFALDPSATKGLATVTIPSTSLDFLTPQFLTFTIYRINEDTTKTVLYADTQFGAKGNLELLGPVSSATPTRYITRFLPITNDDVSPYIVTHFGDAVEVRKPNFVVPESNETLELDFILNGLEAEVTVEYTKDDVISSSTQWSTLEVFSLASTTATLSKTYTYPTYNREISWVRVKYIRASENTGNIDKVLIRL